MHVITLIAINDKIRDGIAVYFLRSDAINVVGTAAQQIIQSLYPAGMTNLIFLLINPPIQF